VRVRRPKTWRPPFNPPCTCTLQFALCTCPLSLSLCLLGVLDFWPWPWPWLLGPGRQPAARRLATQDPLQREAATVQYPPTEYVHALRTENGVGTPEPCERYSKKPCMGAVHRHSLAGAPTSQKLMPPRLLRTCS
jgi:hypothetical protein